MDPEIDRGGRTCRRAALRSARERGASVELPGYKNFREISRGTRSLVFRANRSTDGAPVVVKTVLADRPGANQSAALLRREHEILSTLDMAAVVKPLALEDAHGLPALVLS